MCEGKAGNHLNKKVLIIAVIAVLAVGAGIFFTMNGVGANSVDSTYEKAQAALEEENYEEAIDLYQSVLEKDPAFVDARLGLADAFVAVKESSKAVKTLSDGIYETPEEGKLYTKSSDIQLQLQDVEKAYSALEKGIKYSENDADAVKQAMETLESQISIQSERPRVQKGYERDLQLAWESEEGKFIPLEAKWTKEEDSLGELVTVEGVTGTTFSAEEVGKVVVTAEWESYTEDMEVEVVDQLLDQIEVTPEEIEPLAVGETLDLSVTGYDADGEEMSIQPEWSIEKQLFELDVNQDQTATLTAVEEGQDVLNVRFEDFEEQIDIFVEGSSKIIQTKSQGQGTVTVYPDQDSYSVGEEVTIEAHPALGYEFVRWENDLDGAVNPVNLTVEDHMNVTAVFEPVKHTLTLAKTGEGEVVRDTLETDFEHLAKVPLRARAADGWEFDHWEGSLTSETSDIVVSMNEDKTLRAVFTQVDEETDEEEPEEDEEEQTEAVETYSLNVAINGQGRIQKSASGSQFNDGTNVSLSAIPADGWRFTGWSGDASSSSSSITLKMNRNKVVAANFERKAAPQPEPEPEPTPEPKPKPKPEPEPERYSLTMSVIGEGTIQASNKTVKAGQSISVTAVPDEGYTFVRWEGDVSGSSASTSVTMTRNKQVSAVFAKKAEEPESTESQ